MLHRCLPRPVTSASMLSSCRRPRDLGEHLGEVDLALGRAGGDQVVDLGVALRVQRRRTRGPRAAASAPACRGGGPAARRCRASPGRCAAACRCGIAAIVRMLCRRSASLMIRTRRSFAIATSILRIVAACCASFESNWSRSSLVTPSTIAATSAPNAASTSASVISVSSTASCSSAAASVMSSRPRSATMRATASGWLM